MHNNQLQAAAQRVANAYASIANEKMGCTLPLPVPLKFNLQDSKPKWAGIACGTMRVNLNMILLEDNVTEMLNETIPHEIAHLVQYNKFDHKGGNTQCHGAEWQEIMRKLGKKPTKTHTMDVSRAVAHYKTIKKTKKQLKEIE